MAKYRSSLNRVKKAEKLNAVEYHLSSGFLFILDEQDDFVIFPKTDVLVPDGFEYVSDAASLPLSFDYD